MAAVAPSPLPDLDRTAVALDALHAALPDSVSADPDALAAVQAAVRAALDLEAAHRARQTVENYDYSWERWERWCELLGVPAVPASPDVLAVYVGHLSITGGAGDGGRKATTIATYLSAIGARHRDRGLEDPVKDPVVQRVLRGLRRTKGIRPDRREPMTLARLFAVVGAIDARRLVALRDRVIVAADATVTELGRIRPSQLARLDWDQVRFLPGGVDLDLPPAGRGTSRRRVHVERRGGPLCLVTALEELATFLAERTVAAAVPDAAPLVESQRAAWAATFRIEGGTVTAGPVMPATTRHGALRPGPAGRAAVTTRLARAASLAGVTCPRQRLPRWSDAQRTRAVRLVTATPLADVRDRALLLLGFALAARRSNLSLLLVGEVERHPKGLRVLFRWSKTDQDGRGRHLAVPAYGGPYCPVAAWEAWVTAMTKVLGGVPDDSYPAFPALTPDGRGITGPRAVLVDPSDPDSEVSHWEGITGDEINNIVKRRVRAAGLHVDPDTGVARLWGGHSLRRGWLTEAAHQHMELAAMMAHADHATPATAMEYIEEARLFDPDHSAAMQFRFVTEVADSGRPANDSR